MIKKKQGGVDKALLKARVSLFHLRLGTLESHPWIHVLSMKMEGQDASECGVL